MCGRACSCGSCGRTIGHIVGHRTATASAGSSVLVSAKTEGSWAVKLVKHLSARVNCLVGPADEGGVWAGPVFQRSEFQGPGRDSSSHASENLEARLC